MRCRLGGQLYLPLKKKIPEPDYRYTWDTVDLLLAQVCGRGHAQSFLAEIAAKYPSIIQLEYRSYGIEVTTDAAGTELIVTSYDLRAYVENHCAVNPTFSDFPTYSK